LPRGRHHAHPHVSKVLRFLRRPVVAGHPVAGIEEALREPAAHAAETNEREVQICHQRPSVTAIALISILQRACVASRLTSTVVVVGRWPSRYVAHTRFRSSCSSTSVRNRVADTRSAKEAPADSSVFLRFSMHSTACSRIVSGRSN